MSDSVQPADVGRINGGTLVVAAALVSLWPVMLILMLILMWCSTAAPLWADKGAV